MKIEQSFTVGLVPKAVTDLMKTHERTRLTGADIVNRAISLYDFIDEELHTGAELLLRRRDGSTHLVELL
jgi:hypothetical protein